MSIHTNPFKAVSSLLKHLTPLEKKADLDDLKSELMKIKDLFSIVKRNEEELLDTLTIVYKYLVNSNIDKLMKEKADIRKRIQGSPLLKLLPNSRGGMEVVESSGKTSQHPQKGANFYKKLDASYQIHGLENFMQRYDSLSSQSQSFILLLFLLPKNLFIRNNPRSFYWGIALNFISKEWGFGNTYDADMVLRELSDSQLIVSLIEEGNDVIESDQKCMINPCICDEWVKPLMFAENGQLYERYSQIIAPFGHRIGLSPNPRVALDRKKVKLGDGLGFKSDHLRVIVNVGASYLNFGPKWMAKSKNLKVLHLGRWEDSSSLHIEVETEDFLKELRDQKHLRYLSLRGVSRIFVIPPSIAKLESLKVLNLKACHNLETLPDISSLINLVYLNISQCYLLESMPKGIEKLIKLEVLKGFVIGSSNKTHGRLASLTNLINLRKLSIHIGSDAAMENMEFKYLQFLKLTNLKISWGTFKRYKNSFSFNGFNLPIKLQKLTLEGFPEENISPEWFTIASRTKELRIKGGKLKSFGNSGHDAANYHFDTHILRLKYLKHFKDDSEKILWLFPHMQYVEIKEVEYHFNFNFNFNGSRRSYFMAEEYILNKM